MKEYFNNSIDLARALLSPEAVVDNILARAKVDVIGRRTIVRNGVAFIFEHRRSGVTYVHAARRTAPHLTAIFQVADRAQADAWFADGRLPDDETSGLLAALEAGTWTTSLPSIGSRTDRSK